MNPLSLRSPIDPSGIATLADLADGLQRLKTACDLSYSIIERAAGELPKTNGKAKVLSRSTMSDVLNGKRCPSKDVLLTFLAVCQVSERDRLPWLMAWERVRVFSSQAPTNAVRVDEASPRQLGVWASITTDDTDGDLPTYVPRDQLDDQLRDVLTRYGNAGCFVLLVGSSASGKTRTLYEGVRAVLPDYWLIQPASTIEISTLASSPPTQTVLWLDEIHRFLGVQNQLSTTMIQLLTKAGVIVVGTLWADEFLRRTGPFQAGVSDQYAGDLKLFNCAKVLTVPEAFTAAERQRAALVAVEDSRIRIALGTKDSGVTQALAGGPASVLRWELAPPYAKALINAAVDARRMGIYSPLSDRLLTHAMVDYLPPAQRVTDQSTWLEQALPYVTMSSHGAAPALSPTDGGRPGSFAGYVVSDFLVQHAQRTHRKICPPHSAWQAYIDNPSEPDDVRRLLQSARSRMRYCYLERFLEFLVRAGEVAAVMELADRLFVESRIDEAIDLLHDAMDGADLDVCSVLETRLKAVMALRPKVDGLRLRLIGGDRSAWNEVVDILLNGVQLEVLRIYADEGDAAAADRLAERLVSRGDEAALIDRADAGDQFALYRLADHLVATNQIQRLRSRSDDAAASRLAAHLAALGHIDELKQRATMGDRFAEAQLNRLRNSDDETEAADATDAEICTEGPEEARLLDGLSLAEMHAEVDAGTPHAPERFMALHLAEGSLERHVLDQLMIFGMRADGTVYDPTKPEGIFSSRPGGSLPHRSHALDLWQWKET